MRAAGKADGAKACGLPEPPDRFGAGVPETACRTAMFAASPEPGASGFHVLCCEVVMHFLRFCAKVALTLCLAVGGTGAAFAVSDIQTFRLENGLTVLIKEDSRFPLVSVRLFVKAGSAWEKPEEARMSHLLEHMVFQRSGCGQACGERGRFHERLHLL